MPSARMLERARSGWAATSHARCTRCRHAACTKAWCAASAGVRGEGACGWHIHASERCTHACTP
eukprot:2234211-Prymnesium_polylepis.2